MKRLSTFRQIFIFSTLPFDYDLHRAAARKSAIELEFFLIRVKDDLGTHHHFMAPIKGVAITLTQGFMFEKQQRNLYGTISEYVEEKFQLAFELSVDRGEFRMWQTKPSLSSILSRGYDSLESIYQEISHRIEKAELFLLTQNSEVFRNSIKFSPEHKQAGLQILNYFQETLNQKYPNDEVTVRIGQKGNLVTMEIETPDGQTEKYEEALEEYGLVVTGKKPVEEYLDNPVDQMGLKNQLNLAKAQLDNQQNLIEMKNQVIELQAQTIKRDDLTIESLNVQLVQFTTSYTHLAERLADIAEAGSAHDSVETFKLMDAVLSVKGEAALTAELDTIKEENPPLFSWLQTQATDIGNKTIVGTASKLLIEYFKGYFG